MLGSREAAQLLADHTLELLPGEVDRLATELGTAVAEALPGEPEVTKLDALPRLIAATQLPVTAVGAESWPFVMVVPRTMTGVALVDSDHTGRRTLRQTWMIRWWVYGRGDGYHLTAAVRDRLALAVMEMLWRFPSLRGEVAGQPYQITVVPERMTAAPSDIEEWRSAVVAGCWIEVPVSIDSVLTPRITPRPVTEVAVSSTRLPDPPPHPALA